MDGQARFCEQGRTMWTHKEAARANAWNCHDHNGGAAAPPAPPHMPCTAAARRHRARRATSKCQSQGSRVRLKSDPPHEQGSGSNPVLG
jgi:hypothetical protein